MNGGDVEKYGTNVYVLPESSHDFFLTLQSQFDKGIFSHETALILYGYKTESICYYMTFPKGYRSKNLEKILYDQHTLIKNSTHWD
ncbi:hypothetical protein M2139_002673 [Enterococcus sp. PF1-24]|nr:hypothetical protein [Enterococcus sp. PFB1-1]MDH6402767.1 hypothetical protein [Enterococcus sp. PF1-24]